MVKNFDGSLVPAVKHALVRGSGGMPPGKCWKLGSLRVHLLAIHISVCQAQINRLCSQISITAHKHVIRTARLAQRVTAAGQLDVV